MTGGEIAAWQEGWRAGAIIIGLTSLTVGVAVGWAAAQWLHRHQELLAERRAVYARMFQERDLVERTGLRWPALYDQDERP